MRYPAGGGPIGNACRCVVVLKDLGDAEDGCRRVQALACVLVLTGVDDRESGRLRTSAVNVLVLEAIVGFCVGGKRLWQAGEELKSFDVKAVALIG